MKERDLIQRDSGVVRTLSKAHLATCRSTYPHLRECDVVKVEVLRVPGHGRAGGPNGRSATLLERRVDG